jgi:hypothetical protein
MLWEINNQQTNNVVYCTSAMEKHEELEEKKVIG